MTPETQTVLQSFLIRKAEEWQQYIKEYPELLTHASYHISPDSAYISMEHEEQLVDNEIDRVCGTSRTQLVRLPPSCHKIITKI